MPWHILRHHETVASETLLLDYVSQAQPTCLLTSCKAKHWPVALVVAVSLLIKLLTVLSTGLFMIHHDQNIGHSGMILEAEDRFDGSGWNTTNFSNVPALLAVALLKYNMTFPVGTSDEFAIPTVNAMEHLPGMSLTVRPLQSVQKHIQLKLRDHVDDHNTVVQFPTEVFQADLDCEFGQIWVGGWSCNSTSPRTCGFGNHWTLRLQSDTCQTADFPAPENFVRTMFVNYLQKRLFGVTFSADCGLPSASQSSQERFIIAAGYLDWDRNKPGELQEQKMSSVLVCKRGYSVDQAVARVDRSGNILGVDTRKFQLKASDGRQLGSISNQHFTTRFQNILDSAQRDLETLSYEILGGPQNSDDINGSTYQVSFDSFFELYVALFRPEPDSFLSAETLYNNCRRLFSLVSVQIAKSDLMVKGTTPLNITYFQSEQRLHIRGLSLNWMIATLSTLIITTSLTVFFAPTQMVSRDPGSVGGLATILSRSPSLSKILATYGSATRLSIRRVLQDFKAKTSVEHTITGPEFRIEILRENTPKGPNTAQKIEYSGKVKWWRPLSISAPLKIGLILVLGSLVVALELLFQRSERNHGIVNVNDSSYARYTWVYLPGLIMMVVQLLVGMISFSSNVFLPYHELRHWPSRAPSTMLNDQLSRLTIHSLLDSLFGRHWAIVATATAMLLAPFLTVVASGLYTPDSELASGNVSLQVNSVFEFSVYPNLGVDDKGLGFFTSMILQQDLASQKWTDAGFVFPEISFLAGQNTGVPESSNLLTSEGPKLITTLPAIRSPLSCTLIPEEDRTFKYGTEYEWETYLNISMKIPFGCVDGGDDMFELSFPAFDGYPVAEYHDMVYNDTRIGCPSAVFLYGAMESDLKVMTCTKMIQQLQVKATFDLPSFSILDIEPDENTVKAIPDEVSLLDLFDTALFNMRKIQYSTDNPNVNAIMGNIMLDIAQATSGTIDSVLSSQSSRAVELRLQQLWEIIFVQYANLIARVPAEALDGSTVPSWLSPYTVDTAPFANFTSYAPNTTRLDGTVTHPGTQRLRQDKVSTRILEVLLGAIAVCIALSLWSMNTKEILPKDPCSIGTAASLLAGAEMLRESVIPNGAEWCDDKELKDRGVFEGLLFSMGWWDGKNKEGTVGGDTEEGAARRRFGIDVGKAEWS